MMGHAFSMLCRRLCWAGLDRCGDLCRRARLYAAVVPGRSVRASGSGGWMCSRGLSFCSLVRGRANGGCKGLGEGLELAVRVLPGPAMPCSVQSCPALRSPANSATSPTASTRVPSYPLGSFVSPPSPRRSLILHLPTPSLPVAPAPAVAVSSPNTFELAMNLSHALTISQSPNPQSPAPSQEKEEKKTHNPPLQPPNPRTYSACTAVMRTKFSKSANCAFSCASCAERCAYWRLRCEDCEDCEAVEGREREWCVDIAGGGWMWWMQGRAEEVEWAVARLVLWLGIRSGEEVGAVRGEM